MGNCGFICSSDSFFFLNIAEGTYAFFLPASYFLYACFQKKYVILFFSPDQGKSLLSAMDIVSFFHVLFQK